MKKTNFDLYLEEQLKDPFLLSGLKKRAKLGRDRAAYRATGKGRKGQSPPYLLVEKR